MQKEAQDIEQQIAAMDMKIKSEKILIDKDNQQLEIYSSKFLEMKSTERDLHDKFEREKDELRKLEEKFRNEENLTEEEEIELKRRQKDVKDYE